MRYRALALWPLLGLLLWIGLAFSRESYDPNLLKVLGAWQAVGAAFALLAVDALRGRFRAPEPRPLDLWVVAALAGFGVLALASAYPWFAREAAWGALLTAIAYAAGRLAFRPADGEAISRTLAGATIAAAAFGVVQLVAPGVLGFTFEAPEGWAARTLAATMANPDYFAAWLLMAIPFIARLLDPPGRWRGLASVALSVAVGALVLTFSRAGWLGLVAELALWRYSSGKPLAKKALVLTAATALLVVALVPGIASKVTRSATLLQRCAIWKGAISMAAQRPLFGQGPGAFGAAFPEHRPSAFRATGLTYVDEFAHDLPLHVLAVGGLFGLSLLVFGLAAALPEKRVEARHVALAGMLAQNLFSVTMFVTPFAVLLALLVASAPEPDPLEREPAPPSRLQGSPGANRPRWDAFFAMAALAWVASVGYRHSALDMEASVELRTARAIMDAGAAKPESAWEELASRHLGASLARQPFNPAPRYRLAAAAAYAGNWASAQAHYALLEAISPAFAELPRNRAELYRATGRAEAARRQAQLWIDMNGSDPKSHVLMAKLKEAAGQRSEALENALQAKRLGASDVEVTAMVERLSKP